LAYSCMKKMTGKTYSLDGERDFYRQNWPKEVAPGETLELYLSCWLNAKQLFGNKKVLDIGAGKCGYTRVIAERFNPEMIVACELLTDRMMPVFKVNENRKLCFVTGNCFELPFKNSSFEIVFGSLVLHHLPDLEKVIAEINRVLGRKGRYIGLEPNPFNPLQIYKHYCAGVSPNQILLYPWYLNQFKECGFQIKIKYFYPKLYWLKIPFWGSLMGIIAEKNG